jgi:hypothetical protein
MLISNLISVSRLHSSNALITITSEDILIIASEAFDSGSRISLLNYSLTDFSTITKSASIAFLIIDAIPGILEASWRASVGTNLAKFPQSVSPLLKKKLALRSPR